MRNINYSLPLLFIVVQLTFLCNTAIAQEQFASELDSILRLNITTRDKVTTLGSLAGKHRYVPNSRKLIDTALAISKRSENRWALAHSNYALSNFYFYNGQLDSSLVFLDKAEKLLEKDDEMLKASILSTRGGVFLRSGDFIEAIDVSIAAKAILESLDSTLLDSMENIKRKGRLMVLNNSLGNLYLKIEDFDKALQTYDETFSLAQKLDNLPNASIILSNKGELLYQMERYDEALDVSLQAKEMKERAELPLRFIAISNYHIGLCYQELDSLEIALDYYNIALDQSNKSGYERGKMFALTERGLAYIEQGMLQEAKNDCLKAYDIALQINESDSKIKTCECLHQIEEQLGNFEASLQYYQQYTKLKDSIFNEKNIRKLTQIGMQYEFDKKEAEQQAFIAERDRKRNLLLLGISILLIFSLILAFIYRKQLKYRQTIAKQQEKLKNQEIVKLEQENRLTAINSMIAGQEKERSRIAKELHDGLGSLLSSVKSHFIASQIRPLQDISAPEKTADLIDRACADVRRISHNMMPYVLTISGLEEGIRDIANRLKIENYNVTVEVTELPKLSDTQEVMVYRLVQEIVSNIIKHSEAQSVFLQLYSDVENIYLTVEDDGKGFDLSHKSNEIGLGLQNMKSRVAYLNGTIDIDSAIGSGTTINIKFGYL